jgi:tRNA(fMet)-specific endonuclease VapC
MTHLLDTNACIAIINGKPATVRERFQAALGDGAVMAVPSIVAFELWYGVGKGTRQALNTERLQTFLAGPVDLLAFDEADAQAAGMLCARLEATGTPIGAYELLIAGQALRYQRTLVTANVKEFTRVPGLVFEDWAAEPAARH